jgi:diguanylate cyclase (GGDEF)-like protein/PAS domain S-box-containing protein
MFEHIDENDLPKEGHVDRLTSPCDVASIDAEAAVTFKKIESTRSEFIAAPIAAILDALPQMVRISDPSGRLEYRNKRFYEFTGATPGEVEAEDWKKVVHPEDREEAWAEWCRCLRTGEEYEARYRVRHHSGEYRWILARATPNYDETGNIVRWFGTSTDTHEQKQSEDALRSSEERLRLALQTTGLGIWDADLVTGKREWTREALEILGLAPDAPTTRDTFLDRIHLDDRLRIEAKFFAPMPESIPTYEDECRISRADTGEERWVAISGQTLLNDDGRPIRKLGTIQDITDRKRAEEGLRDSEARLQLALQAARMVAWEQDTRSDHITRSENSLALLGLGSGPLKDFLKRVPLHDRARRDEFVANTQAKGSDTMEFQYVLPDGRSLWLASRAQRAGPNRVVGVTFDITDRKTAEEEIWRAANHDLLTGLPNRRLLQHRLEAALENAKRQKTHVSLLLIDLDDFKDVNDSMGHDAGDALLTETAARLSEMMRDCDTVARLGGDEFAVIVVEPLKLSNALNLANSILKQIREPFVYEGRTILSRASIGLAAYPDHDSEPPELMKDADIALYRAKAEGRGRVAAYSPLMRAAAERRVALSKEVREAVARDEFSPFYQPKVCLRTGAIVGFEALARWLHPEKGLLTPETFGEAFDEPELASVLSKRLIGKVVSDVKKWLEAGLNPGRVAVNLSSSEFNQPHLADDILRLLALAKVPTRHFEVEVTERVLLDGRSGLVSNALEAFRKKGVQIALDDFGTGFASLTHLKQFPVDHIKIDRCFVRDLEHNPDDEAIVQAVIGLATSLTLQVTAEGVETKGQVRRLQEMGCHAAQGYLYARPMAASEVGQFIVQQDLPSRHPTSQAAVTRR